jgi:hypothetical protein
MTFTEMQRRRRLEFFAFERTRERLVLWPFAQRSG